MHNRLLQALYCATGILFSSALFAQNTLNFSGLIEWVEPEKSNVASDGTLFFKGEGFTEDNFNLPLFIEQKQITTNASVDGYRILAQEVTFLPENLLKNIDLQGLTSDWQIKVVTRKGGEKNYLIASILPLRLNGRSVEALTSFTLEVTLGQSGNSRNRTLTFAENSVLSEGKWYKIAIARDGIYRIDKNLLGQLGINTSELNPQNINVYGNGGNLLPVSNADFRHDDLQKNAIFVQGENDGTFNDNDYILFYGQGPDTWKLREETIPRTWAHDKHYYSDSAYYFIRIDDTAPLRVNAQTIPDAAANQTITSFQDYQFIENDQINVAKSGREFFGDPFEFNTSATFSFNFANALPEPALFEYGVAVRSIGGASTFNFSIAGSTGSATPSPTSDDAVSNIANLSYGSINFTPNNSQISIAINFSKFNAEAQGWIDYLRVNAIRSLIMTGSQMRFRDSRVAGAGNISEYQISQASAVNAIWDISNPLFPQSISFQNNNGTVSFKADHSDVREYIAFSLSGFLTPRPVGMVENQNLHSLSNIDYIIITAPAHTPYANELAEIHRAMGMTVEVLSPFKIFNEFSSGNPDVTSFRMLMKMLYDRAANEDEKPKNLLLFGDGSYLTNKGLNAFIGPNVIVFESDNSINPLRSYVSDDYFVFLDDNESGAGIDKLDCGIGRIPASDIGEATTYVSKVRTYLAENTTVDGAAGCVGDDSGSPFGSWRNTLTFVSDDTDGNGSPFETYHLTGSEVLANTLSERHPQYDISKLYMDAFTQVVTPGGERYPEGEDAIRRRVENGSLLVTYTGHGGERGWAHERILTIPTISGWTNKTRLPVFLTATCELSRYDDPGFNSAGEILVMNPNGGAIATMTTTRVVTSNANFEMNVAFFEVAFEKETITDLSLGRINMMTKNEVSSGNLSKLNFSLMGDPAIQMTYPKYYVYTSQINGVSIEAFTDTLKALEEVTFTGYVGDINGNKLTNFNGFIYPNVQDKPTEALTQNNDGNANGPIPFTVYNNNLFRGKASVQGGDFTFKFVVPFDINYNVDTARVSYYAVAGNDDAHGASTRFIVGSSLEGAELNRIGPEVNLFMNDSTFVNGGITNSTPVFVAFLQDENGINTAGAGIGHDLVAILDGDTQNPIRLNDFYESDLDTYKSGSVRYQLNGLTPGPHRISFKAWDVHNNSSERTIEFTVADDTGIELDHVLNFPNPFTTNTAFFFEHNQACEALDVRIQVFTVGGKLVKTINQRVKQNGFRSDSISWDGTDDFGDRIGKGVYVYKLEVRNTETGQQAEKYEKLVILK
ncbi:MAG: type IX secretion system sortase PorU [Flavobacteriales bacterium]